MDELKGKIVVITGGSSGIGLAIIKELLNTDVKFIAMFELDTSNSRKVFEDLEKANEGKIGFYPCDVSNFSQLEEHFESVFQAYQTVDILINNAGIGTENVPDRMIDINCKAVILGSLTMIKRVGKHRGGQGGTIVNIASVLGIRDLLFPVYCATKHAVVSFTRTMEHHFGVTGVRLVAVCPGLTDTPILASNLSSHLDFVSIDPAEASSAETQSPKNVADAVLRIIKDGKCGDVWVSENDEPPYQVEIREVRSNL